MRGTVIGADPIGSYVARKKAVRVDVFVLHVTEILRSWPEAHERQRRWMRPEVAAAMVHEPELGEMIIMAAKKLVPAL